MLNRLYLITGSALIGLYSLVTVMGWEFGHPASRTMPADVRHSPGGYRSFHFWHSGYRGGK
ncbi:MAG TPA: hypothetical protein VG013_21505 [Gemmataceae bacterium]|jgi:hypothetical protein|nr:hypothetical protein [Gemmataceae bacterium]